MKQIGNRGKILIKNIRTLWGFDREVLGQYNISDPVFLGSGSHPHALITGSSGSGKSQALLFIIGRMLQAFYENDEEVDFRLCDFKSSEDYQFLEEISYPKYYGGLDCYDGIMAFYKDFSESRMKKEIGKKKHHFLIIDEYQACVSYYSMKDKRDKTKYSSEILSAVSEILMLGRNTRSGVWHIWVVTQVASATLFANGTRENFMITLAMGNLSREQKGMIFPGQELPDRRFKPGEGMLLADGFEIKEVIFPLIRNVADWKMHIGKILMPDGTAFTL